MGVSDIAKLLSQSRAAHQRSLHARGRIDDKGRISHPPQVRQAGSDIQQALSLRLDAHALDPRQQDPTWAEDRATNKGVSSDGMIAFLGLFLSPREAAASLKS